MLAAAGCCCHCSGDHLPVIAGRSPAAAAWRKQEYSSLEILWSHVLSVSWLLVPPTDHSCLYIRKTPQEKFPSHLLSCPLLYPQSGDVSWARDSVVTVTGSRRHCEEFDWKIRTVPQLSTLTGNNKHRTPASKSSTVLLGPYVL